MRKPAAWWGATVGAVIAYTTAVLVPFPPTLYFFPRLGAWGFLTLPGEPAVSWYGWLIYAAVGALFGIAIGSVIDKRPPWTLAWSIATSSMLVLAWHERQWFLK